MKWNADMFRRWFALSTLAVVGASAPLASAQEGTQTGAVFGGLAGAITGGLIGNNNGKAGEGAAIGGVIGVVTGGLLGNSADKEKRKLEQQQLYALQQREMQRQAAVSMSDVISMTASGLSDSIIINQIDERGVQHRLQVSDILALHENGVREQVIAAMQRATIGRPATAVPVEYQTTVVQHVAAPPAVIVAPRPVVPRYYYYGRPRRPATRGGLTIRF